MSIELFEQQGFNPNYSPVFYEQLCYTILPDMKIRNCVQRFSPAFHKTHTIDLGTGAPHGGAFAPIEHAKLYRRGIGDPSRPSPKSIYLSHDLPLCNSTHSRIATQLGYLIHVEGDKQYPRPHCSRSGSRFATCMPGSDHNHIILFAIHSVVLIFFPQRYKEAIECSWEK